MIFAGSPSYRHGRWTFGRRRSSTRSLPAAWLRCTLGELSQSHGGEDAGRSRRRSDSARIVPFNLHRKLDNQGRGHTPRSFQWFPCGPRDTDVDVLIAEQALADLHGLEPQGTGRDDHRQLCPSRLPGAPVRLPQPGGGRPYSHPLRDRGGQRLPSAFQADRQYEGLKQEVLSCIKKRRPAGLGLRASLLLSTNRKQTIVVLS